MSKLDISVLRANMLMTDSMTSFDQNTNLTKPRIATTYEAMLFTSDGGYFVIDGEKYDIYKGSVRFIKPGQEIYSKKYKDAYVIYFTINKSDFSLIDHILPHHICKNYNENINLFQNVIKCFVNLNSNGLNYYLMYTFLLRLIHNFISDSKVNNDNIGLSDSSVVDATNYIQYNYNKQISLSDIAESVNLHPNYFLKLFKNKTGKTPFDYLTETRMKAACDMLITTTKTVSEISIECGFDSCSYFIYVFKKKKGITPLQFRKLHSYDEFEKI